MTKTLIGKIGSAGRIALSTLLIGTALSVATPKVAKADSITIENTSTADENTNLESQRTRIKAIVGPAVVTYDINREKNPQELKLWADGLSKNGWYLGFLAEGQTNNRENSYADIGVNATKTIGSKTYDAFVGPTVQAGVKPAMFYQFAVRDTGLASKDTDRKKNLVVALVDDREKNFGLNDLDMRVYASTQIGDGFVGLGVRQGDFEFAPSRVYGAGGFNDGNAGTYANFSWNTRNEEMAFKIQSAVGDVNRTGTFKLSNVNLWENMKGPGMRDVSIPYFTSFLTKGNLASVIEGNITPKAEDYQLMVGKNLGIARVGAGVNYHNENGDKTLHGLFHVAKDVKLGKHGKISGEYRYNTRDKQSQMDVNYSRGF